MSAPIETKVTAATSASAVAAFIVGWLVLKVPGLSGLSAPFQSAITALLVSAAAGAAGWLAHHTPRPDLGEAEKAPL